MTANFTNATEILAVGYSQWVDAQVGGADMVTTVNYHREPTGSDMVTTVNYHSGGSL